MTPELISLALILDFSGSMEQKLLDKTKKSILVENVSAFSSSLREQDKYLVISFGSSESTAQGATGCEKVDERIETKATLGNWVKAQSPGKFAATPLARAIRLLKKKLETQTIKRALVITDGNDTCKEDVCQAIAEIDQVLKLKRTTLRFDMLGYDLASKEEKSLSCAGTRLSKVRFKMVTARSDAEFTQEFEKIEQKARAEDAPRRGKATIQVMGAPTSTQFFIQQDPKKPKTQWQGPFPIEVTPGIYTIGVLGFEGVVAPLRLARNQRKKLDFYRDFKLPFAKLSLQGKVLGGVLEPVHSSSSAKITPVRSPDTYELAPGYWRIRLTYPYWISGVKSEQFLLEPGASRQLEAGKLVEKQIQWLEPHPAQDGSGMRILTLERGGNTLKIPVAVGTGKIPVSTGARFKWE